MAASTPPVKGTVTRERVIEEAAKLFAEKGYAAATTREIAARLNIQRASLYYHMSGKDQILFEICETAMTQGISEVRSALAKIPEDDVLGKIKQLIGTHLQTSLGSRDQHLTMLLEMRSLEGEHKARIFGLRAEYRSLIDEVLSAAQKEGALRQDIPARDLRIVLLNMLNWSLTWFTPGVGFTPETLADLLGTIFLEGSSLQPSSSSSVLSAVARAQG
jgi:AcrR family transcriptional regulator